MLHDQSFEPCKKRLNYLPVLGCVGLTLFLASDIFISPQNHEVLLFQGSLKFFIYRRSIGRKHPEPEVSENFRLQLTLKSSEFSCDSPKLTHRCSRIYTLFLLIFRHTRVKVILRCHPRALWWACCLPLTISIKIILVLVLEKKHIYSNFGIEHFKKLTSNSIDVILISMALENALRVFSGSLSPWPPRCPQIMMPWFWFYFLVLKIFAKVLVSNSQLSSWMR